MLNATSYDSKSNQPYGYSISGPKADPDSADTSVRAACIEYRCPTSDPVRVDVRIIPRYVHIAGSLIPKNTFILKYIAF